MREALNGRPANQRTRREYQRAIDAYRRVYFGSPASSKADPSVVATAELLVEMGRRFDDNKILRGAVDEYRFLRKEYPGSRYRFEALFTIGEIYKDDLNDSEQARKTFEDFLHRYPRNRLADDARAAVKELEDAAVEAKERTAHKGRGKEGGKGVGADARSQTSNATSNAASDAALASGTHGEARRNELPRVTGVRHWSTPDYTRVAIDVEQDVKFSSQRIANPDRIFFDIQDTKLASTLVGKTFDVDDGFLKKIRVAENKPGQTRIVLEVDDLARYDAFLLPDPYRLIIDVHGKQSRTAELAKAHGAGGVAAPAVETSAASNSTDEDDASDMREEQKGKVLAEKEHAIVGKAGAGKVGTGRAEANKSEVAKNDDANANASDADEGTPARRTTGIVKTTVAVKGTDRRIPKTIVGLDDDASAKTRKRVRKKQRGSGAERPESATNGSGTSDAGDDAAVADATSKTDDSALAAAPKGTALTGSASRGKKARGSSALPADAVDVGTREARPTAAGSRSLTRALGLKIGKIVIDAGHGGHDAGTIGPNGLLEKDLVLDVAKRLGRLLETRLGAEVIYTRRDDTFIPLETRTAIANRERADLFISIHANSSRDEDARGVETYYLNFTSSPEALEVAARENAVSEKSIHELQDLVKKIALKEKIDESREFASDVQDSLYGGLALRNSGIRNRGVKKAPFIVLIGANMPSILAEISFVSNPTDERKLETSEHRQRIAESLYRGVARYAGGLSGVKVASKIEKTEGQ
jgi:N-acetylmuramoyl-L-alanine amidase